jgi:predicted DNA-binding helix-hairpin-helix protein
LHDIVEPIKLISRLTAHSRRRVKQTTQFVVGAAGETDRQIVNYTAALYERVGLGRVYFSAYQSFGSDSLKGQSINPQQSFMREHRLYQADFLLRKYGFNQSDILCDSSGLLSLETDPKEVWAKSHPEFFPVSVNSATRYNLLRVPGLGLKTVEMILNKRKLAKIHSIDDIDKVTASLFKAVKYLDFGGSVKLHQLRPPADCDVKYLDFGNSAKNKEYLFDF